MKKNVHPQVHKNAVVKCACGNTFTTISTQQSITVDICSACHPYFTGQQKFVDTEGRIEKFQKKFELSKQKKAELEAKKQAKKAKVQPKAESVKAPTLKELLEETQNQEQTNQ